MLAFCRHIALRMRLLDAYLVRFLDNFPMRLLDVFSIWLIFQWLLVRLIDIFSIWLIFQWLLVRLIDVFYRHVLYTVWITIRGKCFYLPFLYCFTKVIYYSKCMTKEWNIIRLSSSCKTIFLEFWKPMNRHISLFCNWKIQFTHTTSILMYIYCCLRSYNPRKKNHTNLVGTSIKPS